LPTKVLDLDLEQLPPVIAGLERYPRALVLLRWRSKPVGQVLLNTPHGRITRADLLRAAATMEEMWERVDQLQLFDALQWDEVDVDMPEPGPATVAVCTRDRPDDLRRCLPALLQLPDDGQEYLVIDNCPSTNETEKLVAAFGERVRYVREDRPGLDVARNRALREARHEIVAFNDDDAIPDPGWLRALIRNFRDPNVLCVTGLTMPFELETEAQEWFERYSPFNRGFKRRVFHLWNLPPLASARVGAGANMAVRRSILERVGPFEEALDGGTPTRSGGDTEMFARILSNGYRIAYEPQALSWHRHRRTWQSLRNTVYGYGVGVYAVFTHQLLVEHEFTVFLRALAWFYYDQLPRLLRAARGDPQNLPLDLILAELKGCLAGPLAYLRARFQAHHRHTWRKPDVPLAQHHYSNP
jgi:GT2 family glycosyltransferase